MTTNRSLRAFRENFQLFLKILLLYDADQSKDIYSYWKHELFNIGTIDEEQCFIDFRFTKNNFHVLLDALNITDRVITTQGTVCDGIEV